MRRLFRSVLFLVAGLLPCAASIAQNFPDKPIRLLIGWPAGGPSDLGTRMFADTISATLGQPVIAENRPGASGQIAHDVLKTSPADGYTIEVYTTPTLLSTLLVGKPVSPSEITPIGLHYDAPGGVLVNPAAPMMSGVTSMKDLVAVVKANPGKLTYTSAGTGTTGHLLGAWIGIGEGLTWEHVAYKGVVPASVDVVAGRVPVMFGAVANEQQLIKDGKLRVISTTGATRIGRFPSTPSLAESGYGQYSVASWGGLAAPAGTPRVAVDRIAAGMRALFDKPDLVAKLAIHNPEPKFQTADVLDRRIREDIQNFSRIIREAGIKSE